MYMCACLLSIPNSSSIYACTVSLRRLPGKQAGAGVADRRYEDGRLRRECGGVYFCPPVMVGDVGLPRVAEISAVALSLGETSACTVIRPRCAPIYPSFWELARHIPAATASVN